MYSLVVVFSVVFVGAEACHRAFPARQSMRSLIGMLYPVFFAAFVSVCIPGCSRSSERLLISPCCFLLKCVIGCGCSSKD